MIGRGTDKNSFRNRCSTPVVDHGSNKEATFNAINSRSLVCLNITINLQNYVHRRICRNLSPDRLDQFNFRGLTESSTKRKVPPCRHIRQRLRRSLCRCDILNIQIARTVRRETCKSMLANSCFKAHASCQILFLAADGCRTRGQTHLR